MKEKMFSVGGKDLEWDYFRVGGNGGQKQQKTNAGARVHHRASGAVGESRESRSQVQNRRIALERLANSTKFRMWVAERHQDIERGETIEQQVTELMNSRYLKLEVKEDGRWVETTL